MGEKTPATVMSNTMKFIKNLLKESKVKCIELKGKCQNCEKAVSVVIWEEGFEIEGNGGIIVGKAWNGMPEFKCSECLERDCGMISPQRTEVFSRVSGYLRPVSHWNPGKKAEFSIRTNFNFKTQIKTPMIIPDLTQSIDITDVIEGVEQEISRL